MRKIIRDKWLYTRYIFSVMKKLISPTENKECNICGYIGHFRSFGNPPRYNARCKNCHSLERHRLLKIWWDQNKEEMKLANVLHIAPETNIKKFIKPNVKTYQSLDIIPGNADLTLDIENTGLRKEYYDLIICSHVLEHVNNDKKALLEMYRILHNSGTLIIMTPIIEGWDETYEDSKIIFPKDREIHFGQYDHVRLYGKNLRDRIRNAGFIIIEMTAKPPLSLKYGLTNGEKLFVCAKK